MNTQNDTKRKKQTSKTKARCFEIERAKSNMICMGKRWSHFDLSLSRSFRVLIVGVWKKFKKNKKQKIAFKIARAREYSKSISLSHIDQTHNLKQQSALERERERERERETTKRKRGHHEESRRRPHEDSAFFSRYPSESSDEDAGGGPTTTTTTTTTTVRLCFENTTTLQR